MARSLRAVSIPRGGLRAPKAVRRSSPLGGAVKSIGITRGRGNYRGNLAGRVQMSTGRKATAAMRTRSTGRSLRAY